MDVTVTPTEEVRRLEPTPSTVRRLFALSHNHCAFPSCPVEIATNDSAVLKAAVCHIEAAEVEGERFNLSMTNEERRHYDNLIVLCPTHHSETDDVDRYPVPALKKMKLDHIEMMRRLHTSVYEVIKYSTALAYVVNAIGSAEFLDGHEPPDDRTRFEIEAKITYNQVKRYASIIGQYSVYQGKLTKLYTEIETQGSGKKQALLHTIQRLYSDAKTKFVTGNITVQDVADDLFSEVEARLWDILENRSSNLEESLSYEERDTAISIVMVDAFMRCRILEEPV